MKDKIAALFGLEEETSPLGAILGPLFLLFAAVLILKVPSVYNYDLLCVTILGLFLIAKWRTHGCIAALLLLAFSAGAKHAFFPTHHAWQAGLECSIGIAFFISALVFEEGSKWSLSKQSEVERNEKTILFLEEDLSEQKALLAKEVAAAAERLGALRLQLEEAEAAGSTLQVLNDVLRKSSAKAIEEKEEMGRQARMFDRKEGLLLEEIASLQAELNRLGNESALIEQNRQLFNELNATRLLEAQTQLVNETLVRLHAKENQKVREYEAKLIEKSEPVVPEELTQQLSIYQTRLEQYRHMELLYRQLKGQFEEKNEMLHQVRRELFHADTELQTAKQKLQEKELDTNPVGRDVYLEMDAMEEECKILQLENEELQAIVSTLMNDSVKKK